MNSKIKILNLTNTISRKVCIFVSKVLFKWRFEYFDIKILFSIMVSSVNAIGWDYQYILIS